MVKIKADSQIGTPKWWVHLKHGGACNTLLITKGWFCGHICLFSQRGH
jgi:hypothetical protein